MDTDRAVEWPVPFSSDTVRQVDGGVAFGNCLLIASTHQYLNQPTIRHLPTNPLLAARGPP